MNARGHRLVAWGWVAALGLALLGTTVAGEMAGRFGDGFIRIRPFMQSYNWAVSALHLLALLMLTVGALRMASRPAALAFALAAVVTLAMVLFPWVIGNGPFAPHAVEVRALRVMVFAPSLLRTLGCVVVAMVMLRSHTASYGIVALLAADTVLEIWRWAHTEKAVIACFHPYCTTPLGLLPWAAATGLFLWATSPPPTSTAPERTSPGS